MLPMTTLTPEATTLSPVDGRSKPVFQPTPLSLGYRHRVHAMVKPIGSLPINLMVAQLVRIGHTPVQFQLGAKYYADGPTSSPDWGIRFNITLLFPK